MKIKELFAPIKAAHQWLLKAMSSDPTASSSRALQVFIVLNVTSMSWVVLAKANWVIAPTTQVVLVTLIVSGAGAYAAGKLGEKP